jgi:hypothetical protein
MSATFSTLKLEGGLIGYDIIERITAGEECGQKPADFGFDTRSRLSDEIAAAWSDARDLWHVLERRLDRLPQDDPATSVTRDQWVIPLLSSFGYELIYQPRAAEIDGLTFSISHKAGKEDGTPPVHVVGVRQSLDRKPESGRPRLAPHALLQEYLNRTDQVWGFVTNGRTLRILRDSQRMRKQAYIEFDLQQMMAGEKFADFALLYRLLHRTRLPQTLADAHECFLEKYYLLTIEQGGRVRDHLRDGVESALKIFANGFINNSRNSGLRQEISSGKLIPQRFYRQLLRLIYRFLFLMVAEERNLITDNAIYAEHYSISRLRRLLEARSSWTFHDDLWLGLRTTFRLFRDEKLSQYLNVPPLNGDLFNGPEMSSLDDVSLKNRELLNALWHLGMYREDERAPWHRINYAALDVEELGSVYESLLEFHPVFIEKDGELNFDLVYGTERKSTGSYYTPPELVQELIKSALVPVIEDRLKKASSKEEALLSIRVLDPACGSGHFLLAAARRLGRELAKLRTGEDEPTPESLRLAIRDIITHCVYGVDKNPLAVDLCKVALWIEGHAKDKPLTFLDHRIRCGDSLVGLMDLNVLKDGIPDEAFDPVEGDEKSVARSLKKRNKEERAGQRTLPFETARELKDLKDYLGVLSQIPDDTPANIRKKTDAYHKLHSLGTKWWRDQTACNLWTAAFFVELTAENEGENRIPTYEILMSYLDSGAADARTTGYSWLLAQRYAFFHWPLEFPEVFVQGGFDVVVGNPPYDVIKENKYNKYGLARGTCNLFSHFIIRAVDLLSGKGNLGYVVPLSFSCGETFEGVRRKVYENFAEVRVSHYSIRPARLFADVDQRITLIRAIYKGKQPCLVYSTRLHRWHPGEEDRVIAGAEFGLIGEMARGLIPKVAGDLGAAIYNKITNQSHKIGEWIIRDKDVGVEVFYHSISRYWIKAYNFIPYFQRNNEPPSFSTKLRRVFLVDSSRAQRFLCLMNSSIFYYWWMTQSDEFDVLDSEIKGFGVPSESAEWPSDARTAQLIERLMSSYRENSIRRTRKFGGKTVTYDEFRPRRSIREIYAIDEAIAPLYGLTNQESVFIRNYDLEFRTDEE